MRISKQGIIYLNYKTKIYVLFKDNINRALDLVCKILKGESKTMKTTKTTRSRN